MWHLRGEISCCRYGFQYSLFATFVNIYSTLKAIIFASLPYLWQQMDILLPHAHRNTDARGREVHRLSAASGQKQIQGTEGLRTRKGCCIMCSCAARCKQECYLYGTTLCVCSLCSGLVLRRKHGDGAAHIIPEQRNAVFQYAVAGAVHHALANQVGAHGGEGGRLYTHYPG